MTSMGVGLKRVAGVMAQLGEVRWLTHKAHRVHAPPPPLVLLEMWKQEHIAILTLNNPSQRNAMSVPMSIEFEARVNDLSKDPKLACVVLTGANGCFSAGGDLNFLLERAADTPQNNVATMLKFYERFLSVRKLGVPVVCSLGGPAVGAGLALALAADVRIAAPGATLGLPFTRIGLHPGMGSTHFLPLVVGWERASRLLYTSGSVQSEEAVAWGLVSEVANEPLARALEWAQEVAAQPLGAVRMVNSTLRAKQDQGLREALEREAHAQALSYASPEFRQNLDKLFKKIKDKPDSQQPQTSPQTSPSSTSS